MKLAVTPFHTTNIPALLDAGADIIIIGHASFANRLTNSFSELEIADVVKIVKQKSKEVYIQMNQIIHNKDLEDLEQFMDFIVSLNVDGIIFGDLAVLQIAKRKHIEHLLIYNPETLNTNYYDAIYWGKQGMKGLFIAKELPMEDIITIHEKSPIDIAMIGHGHLNMFHSRRPLIENFFKFRNEEYEKHIDNRNLRLVEEIRNESYPVFQDEHGTHIFRDKAMASYREIYTLEKAVDVFVIDAIFKDPSYLLGTTTNYRLLLEQHNQQKADELSELSKTDHDTGFLYKKTVYDKY